MRQPQAISGAASQPVANSAPPRVISHLDHFVLTTADEMVCVDFYTRVMGMSLETFIGGTPPVERRALKFGNQKINLHIKGKEFEPKATLPTPGALDLCFISSVTLEAAISRIQECGWSAANSHYRR